MIRYNHADVFDRHKESVRYTCLNTKEESVEYTLT